MGKYEIKDKYLRKLYRIKGLMPDVYAISSSAVQCFLVVGRTKAMLVDTAYGFGDLSKVVKELTDFPVMVVNSHCHVDHSGGNFFFGTPVYIHEADRALYKRHNSPEIHRLMEKSLRIFNKIFFWRILVPRHPDEFDDKRENFDNFCYLQDGDTFDLGSLTAEIIHIPGHTQGSVAILFREMKLLITSDGANPGTYLFLPESTTVARYIESLHKLEGFDFDKILTGHSDTLFPSSALQEWINVAEHLGLSHAREGKESLVAPGVTQLLVWAEDDPGHKGPHLEIDRNKIK